MQLTAYLAPRGFEDELARELGSFAARHGRLFVCEGPAKSVGFVQNLWRDPRYIEFDSISKAAKALREIQPGWALYDFTLHRRAKLIAEKLPRRAAKRFVFGNPAPSSALGSWTLIEENLILAAPSCSSPFPNGELEFEENKTDPPSRAYLKLWEFFTLSGQKPAPGEFCLDLGSSPGGWTWVLAGLGANVLSVDKAPLAPNVAAMPGVSYRQESAFALSPKDFPAVDWLFSDVICYPERLYTHVTRWLEAGCCRNFVCTLKFQGETDFNTLRRFQEIPGSRLLHLSCNKHELTWARLAGGSAPDAAFDFSAAPG